MSPRTFARAPLFPALGLLALASLLVLASSAAVVVAYADDGAKAPPPVADDGAKAPPIVRPVAGAEAASDLATARAVERGVVGALEGVRRSSVSILNRRRAPRDGRADRPLFVGSVGSGVLISYRGTWILTNNHVVDDADALEVVSHDGVYRAATVRARSARHDVALLSLAKPIDGATPVPLLSGSAGCSPGQIVLATGNPFFLADDGTCVPSLGVVSGAPRWIERELINGQTIQHDAPVNPGNSGGPLWGADGRLLGINETIATHSMLQGSGPCSTGASYSIALAQLRRVVAELLDPPSERPSSWRRVSFFTSRDAGGRASGAEASGASVGGGDALAALGLSDGDVVVAVTLLGPGAAGARRPVRTAQELTEILDAAPEVVARIDSRRGLHARSWFGPVPRVDSRQAESRRKDPGRKDSSPTERR